MYTIGVLERDSIDKLQYSQKFNNIKSGLLSRNDFRGSPMSTLSPSFTKHNTAAIQESTQRHPVEVELGVGGPAGRENPDESLRCVFLFRFS
jgi:hypothetical protein